MGTEPCTKAASSTSCLCQDCNIIRAWLVHGEHTGAPTAEGDLAQSAAHCLRILRVRGRLRRRLRSLARNSIADLKTGPMLDDLDDRRADRYLVPREAQDQDYSQR